MEVLFSRKKLSYTRSAPEMASRLGKSLYHVIYLMDTCDKEEWLVRKRLLSLPLPLNLCFLSLIPSLHKFQLTSRKRYLWSLTRVAQLILQPLLLPIYIMVNPPLFHMWRQLFHVLLEIKRLHRSFDRRNTELMVGIVSVCVNR
ncbi:hypothetical protein OUZ56_023742 [Daphnia magna]|uniref:Uncharacterized protein n=1 Tax=Daphnia magna TaxID=35525 RepID=A0ABR0AZD2_9CRUS|nr:hypothetical protein OUZ56_023742 [Daphnia magna]